MVQLVHPKMAQPKAVRGGGLSASSLPLLGSALSDTNVRQPSQKAGESQQ